MGVGDVSEFDVFHCSSSIKDFLVGVNTFFVFLFASVRAFALLYFMLTGRTAHEPVRIYSCLNLHGRSLAETETKGEKKMKK